MVKQATKAQRQRWEDIRSFRCILALVSCTGPTQIHHCGTGAGGRKDHNHVIGLCYHHHVGKEGIHTIGRKKWQAKYGSEVTLMVKTQDLLDASIINRSLYV